MSDVPEVHRDTPKSAFEKLSPADQSIVYMRIDGFMPRHITNILNHRNPDQTTWLREGEVREWFKGRGRLRKAYKEKLKERRAWLKKAREKMPEMLMSASVEAFYVLLNHVRKNDPKSATEILDRAGFVPTQKIDINSDKLDQAVDDLAKITHDLRGNKTT